MTKESQNTEWKESWNDKYYKWMCGFANAQGGRLYIGINDKGVVKGITGIEKLLEDIPIKAKAQMGIMVDVNLHTEGELNYLEIVVDAYPNPISLRGTYYYRSGSTLQELIGPALDKFILERQGKKWDGVPVPGVSLSDLDTNAFEIFRTNAAKSERLSEEALKLTDKELLESLHLVDGDYLKRACVLLFHPDPEKYITGAFVKIGRFGADDELKYHDEIHGSLLYQAEELLLLLRTKYDIAAISYEEGTRLEKFFFPPMAIREALLNAIAHKDYSGGAPIQISVYQDKVIFWNQGQLPQNWTVKKLSEKHASVPYNPDIAKTLFRAGFIEAWGQGTNKMINACKKHKIAPPRFSNEAPDFQVELIKFSDAGLAVEGLKEELRTIVLYVQEHGSVSNSIVQEICEVSKRTATRYLTDLEENYLAKSGTTGAGTNYILKGATMGPEKTN
jgi:ATP-dependent DNA helicase RecG